MRSFRSGGSLKIARRCSSAELLNQQLNRLNRLNRPLVQPFARVPRARVLLNAMQTGPASGPQSDPLIEAQDRFITVWGQMAGAWGISRTMAEVHALLFITGAPMCTDDLMERLQISRGNASMSMRALLEWGIIERTHRRGDRKEYFRAEQDVWSLFRAIVRERMKREVDPLLAALYEIRDLTHAVDAAPAKRRARASARGDAPTAAADHARRIDDMIDFFATVEGLAQRFASPTSGRGLQLAAKLLKRAVRPARSDAPEREPPPGDSAQ